MSDDDAVRRFIKATYPEARELVSAPDPAAPEQRIQDPREFVRVFLQRPKPSLAAVYADAIALCTILDENCDLYRRAAQTSLCSLWEQFVGGSPRHQHTAYLVLHEYFAHQGDFQKMADCARASAMAMPEVCGELEKYFEQARQELGQQFENLRKSLDP